MKVLVYGINYAPELTGIGKYTGEMAEWFAAEGHEVRVVTAPPYYPDWQIAKAYSGQKYTRENLNEVGVWRCPLYVPKKPSGLKRIIHLASFAATSFPVLLRQLIWKPDVIFVVEPPLFCAPGAWFVARLSRAKCWLHIQDFEVDAAFDLGLIKLSWVRKSVEWVERKLMRRFDVVSTISKAMVNKLNTKGIMNPVFFPNWSNLSIISYNLTEGEAFRRELGISDEQQLCLYSGNIAVKQGLEILLDVAKALPSCHFLICGDGANRKALQQKARGINNISFIPLQPLNKLSAMLNAADIHLVIQKAGAADLVMPSKLTNILTVGGVAIVTAESDTELGRLAEGDKACVFRCNPENEFELVEAIRTVVRCTELKEKLKSNALRYTKQNIEMNSVLKQVEDRIRWIVK